MNVIMDTSSSSSSEDDFVHVIRRRKVYKDRVDCFNKYNETEFFERFRLTKETVLSLMALIEDAISVPSTKGGSIPAMHRLLLTLRFYATGNMLISVADFVGVSKASACRIVKKVTYAIASLSPRYIKMYSTNAEMDRAAEEFYRLARFPRIVGVIDCTLIKIQSPGTEDGEIFRSRKGFFALNVQTVSDAGLKIRNIVEPYLMTPLQHVQTPAENLYNESIIRTRNVVERQYGVWKRRFPILSLGMRLQLETAMNVIVATAVLHNMAIDMSENFPEEWANPLNDGEAYDGNNNPDRVQGRGRDVRQLLINEHFGRL